MGWTISHAPYDETITRSASALHELGRHVAHVLPSRHWKVLRPLFDRAEESGDPFTVDFEQAGPIADALRLAACSARMPDDARRLAHALADAGDTAAKQREPWSWS
jgi:hypothetical protein